MSEKIHSSFWLDPDPLELTFCEDFNILKAIDNLGQNTWRFFHVLANFSFTTSETEGDYYHPKANTRVVSRVLLL